MRNIFTSKPVEQRAPDSVEISYLNGLETAPTQNLTVRTERLEQLAKDITETIKSTVKSKGYSCAVRIPGYSIDEPEKVLTQQLSPILTELQALGYGADVYRGTVRISWRSPEKETPPPTPTGGWLKGLKSQKDGH